MIKFIFKIYLILLKGLLELEASLPPSALQIKLTPPKRTTTTKDGYMKRKYRQEKELQEIQDVCLLAFVIVILLLNYFKLN